MGLAEKGLLDIEPGKRGWFEVRSTGAISASDSPLFGADWQCSGEKPHYDLTKRRFQLLIGDLVSCQGPEISLFSNNAGRDIRKDMLGSVWVEWLEKRVPGRPVLGCPGSPPGFSGSLFRVKS
jgi:hypothetical protein